MVERQLTGIQPGEAASFNLQAYFVEAGRYCISCNGLVRAPG